MNATGRLEGQEEVALRSGEDVVRLRKAVRDRAVALGFSLVDQTKIVTAASELGRNTIQHGRGGRAQVAEHLRRRAARASASSSSTTAPASPTSSRHWWTASPPAAAWGWGWAGAKRLSNEFEIESTPGKGTRVAIVRWKPL